MVTSKSVVPSNSRPRGDGFTELFLDEQLCFTLYATSLAMTKVYRPLLTPLGLTYPQYVVMLALWQHGEMTAGSLGEQVALDSGTLVPVVRKLTTLGLVKRERNPADDRSVLIALTAAGRKQVNGAKVVKDKIACATQFTAAESQTLMLSLKKLRAALTGSAATSSLPVVQPITRKK